MSGSKHAPVLPMMEPARPLEQPPSTTPHSLPDVVPGATAVAAPVVAPAPLPAPAPTPDGVGLEPREAAVAHSAAEFTEEAMLRPSARPPSRGWRRGGWRSRRWSR